ncbi:PKD domain-containing protein [bacterium]|nr:PKD domain-containing protein [bacterium]
MKTCIGPMIALSMFIAAARSQGQVYEASFQTVREGDNTLYVDFYLRLLPGQSSEKLGNLTLFLDYSTEELTFVGKVAADDGPWDDSNADLPGSYKDVSTLNRGNSGRFSIDFAKEVQAPENGGLEAVLCPTRIGRIQFVRHHENPTLAFNPQFIGLTNWNMNDITAQIVLSDQPPVLCGDYGDLPASYDAPIPAWHKLSKNSSQAVWLGNAEDQPDEEPGPVSPLDGTGDDANGRIPDDENGVALPAILYLGQTAAIPITYSVAAGVTAFVQGWFDWNGDGDFSDSGEAPISLTVTGTGSVSPELTVDAVGPYTGLTFARFRISTTQNMLPYGVYDNGEVEDYAFQLQAIPVCPADFSMSTDSICTHQAVTFTYIGAASPTQLLWSFGDGATAAGNTVSHAYLKSGVYQVRLQTTCAEGGNGTQTQELVVCPAASDYLVTTWVAPESPISLGTAVQCSALVEPSGDALDFIWNFGDGTTASGNPVIKMYQEPGSYPVSVTLVTSRCGEQVFSHPIQIEILTVNRAPHAVDDTLHVTMNTPAIVQVLANDSDPDGHELHVDAEAVQAPAHGVLVIGADGICTFTPAADYAGEDLFRYRVCDNGVPSLCDTATVLVTVERPAIDLFDYGSDALPQARYRFNEEVFIGLINQTGPWVDAETTPNDGSENDGIEFGPTDPGSPSSVKISVSRPGVIAAWIDFNDDHDWDDADENIIPARMINGGEITTFHFNVPAEASAGTEMWARFRYASGAQIPPLAAVADPAGYQDGYDGEVQDFYFRLTPVELTSFSVNSSGVGVQLEWQTASETENLGFGIYRADAQDGNYTQITASLIPGAGTTSSAHTYRYLDITAQAGETYYYKLADVDYHGRITLYGPVKIAVEGPAEYTLQQNYPNPFNPETRINFTMKEKGRVELSVFNLQGRMVRQLVAKHLGAGVHSVTWDGRDANGQVAPSGIYLYKLQVNGFETMRKMEFIK